MENPINLTNIYTRKQLNGVLSQLGDFLESYFFSSENSADNPEVALQNYLKQHNNPEVHALSTIPANFWSSLSRENCHKTLSDIKSECERLPSLILKTAQPLTTEHVAEFTPWLREATGQTLLLENIPQANLLGGCVIIWGDKYYDYSLKNSLRQGSTLIDKVTATALNTRRGNNGAG